MPFDKVVDSAKLDAEMAATAAAIRAKTGKTDTIPWEDQTGFAGELNALVSVEQATPSISVSSGGLITASAEQAGGIVPAGTKSATQQLSTQAAKTVTPSTSNQTAVAKGKYTTGAVTVKGDANLKADNIAIGISIFGITGTFDGSVKVATGTWTTPTGSTNRSKELGENPLTITGLTFQPTRVIIFADLSSSYMTPYLSQNIIFADSLSCKFFITEHSEGYDDESSWDSYGCYAYGTAQGFNFNLTSDGFSITATKNSAASDCDWYGVTYHYIAIG